MSSLVYFKAILGPQLYRIHQSGNIPGHIYVANTAESFGDSIIRWIKVGWSVSCWTSPLLLTFLYRRAFGRVLNNDYTTFLHVLNAAQNSFTAENKRRLAQYDFDFSAWPVDFKWNEVNQKPGVTTLWRPSTSQGFIGRMKALPCELLAYLSVHTFGRRMVYPGTTAIIQTLMASGLIQGRAKLVEEYGGIRAKLRTRDNNDIDSMFVDRRYTSSAGANGKKLVICCEGNSGFYEVGCMCTPLEAGYSVLGWNHPGFWGSTGVPFPSQEQHAIDAVVQYAIHKLGFPPDRIILFAWSIGGYSATWAAMNYPDIRHVVLDATFDDILPLAYTKLPSSWGSLVDIAVRNYMNLNNAEQLCRYPGPVLLIRRSKDEMITTGESTDISSNRGNDLAVKLLKCRYPNVVDDTTIGYLRQWLSSDQSGQTLLRRDYNVSEDVYERAVAALDEAEETYPSALGQGLPVRQKISLVLFLISKYMEDYDSTHCTPLPPTYFHEPWTESTLRHRAK